MNYIHIYNFPLRILYKCCYEGRHAITKNANKKLNNKRILEACNNLTLRWRFIQVFMS